MMKSRMSLLALVLAAACARKSAAADPVPPVDVKNATFFNRLKRQVAQDWHPDVVDLRRDPTGNIYATGDRITVLRVSLNPNGSVARIYVAKQSGVDFLDDEAVRAFREAQPFPNPPSGLVDARSNVITFMFGFHFAIGGDRSRWKVFRYQ